MRYVIQLLIIICFTFMGEVLHKALPLPIPSAIYGILLLFTALRLKIVKVSQIREVSTTLIKAMPVMFVPPAVRLMETWGQVSDNWLQYLVIIVLSTFVVMGASGWFAQAVMNRRLKRDGKL